jgi:hypothetical protein
LKGGGIRLCKEAVATIRCDLYTLCTGGEPRRDIIVGRRKKPEVANRRGTWGAGRPRLSRSAVANAGGASVFGGGL